MIGSAVNPDHVGAGCSPFSLINTSVASRFTDILLTNRLIIAAIVWQKTSFLEKTKPDTEEKCKLKEKRRRRSELVKESET